MFGGALAVGVDQGLDDSVGPLLQGGRCLQVTRDKRFMHLHECLCVRPSVSTAHNDRLCQYTRACVCAGRGITLHMRLSERTRDSL